MTMSTRVEDRLDRAVRDGMRRGQQLVAMRLVDERLELRGVNAGRNGCDVRVLPPDDMTLMKSAPSETRRRTRRSTPRPRRAAPPK